MINSKSLCVPCFARGEEHLLDTEEDRVTAALTATALGFMDNGGRGTLSVVGDECGTPLVRVSCVSASVVSFASLAASLSQNHSRN